MVKRGELWWVELSTVMVAAVTSNVALADLPGNVALDTDGTGLDRPSVVDVTQVGTVDRQYLDTRIGTLPRSRLTALDAGLRLALRL